MFKKGAKGFAGGMSAGHYSTASSATTTRDLNEPDAGCELDLVGTNLFLRRAGSYQDGRAEKELAGGVTVKRSALRGGVGDAEKERVENGER
jgi:hypothetical protein